jgi:hypothetical protein
VLELEDRYKVKITAGYATTGHAPGGEHPLGLAVDVVPDPAKGGSWDDVNALAKWAAAHPDVFRFVGYDGRFGTTAWPGHGEGNHLHLSWHGGGVDGDTAPLKTITGDNSLLASAIDGVGGAIGGAAGAIKDKVTGAAEDAATAGAKAVVGKLWDSVGHDGARALLYALLVFGGVGLAVVGIARATGVGQAAKTAAGTAGQLGLTAATKGAL